MILFFTHLNAGLNELNAPNRNGN